MLQIWKIGRDDRIRTCDPHTPSVMRYQAALRPDRHCPRCGHWKRAYMVVLWQKQGGFGALTLRRGGAGDNRARLFHRTDQKTVP